MTGVNRRVVMGGLGGAALTQAGWAKTENTDSPLAHGVLAKNDLAKAFEKTWPRLPDVTFVGPDGDFRPKDLLGRTILMPLWAEWCAPCLSEIPDFAKLQKKYGNDKFEVIPVLTAPSHKLSPAKILELFTILHATALKPVMEKYLGNTLAAQMGRSERGWSLPCNLIIAPDGLVVGREMGRIPAPDATAGAAPPKTGDAESVTRAINGQTQSLWGKAEGEEFGAAMAAGFLA